MRSILLESFKIWLPLAITSVVIFLGAYILVQQEMRLSANDPQIQIAEDTANAISGGKNPLFYELKDKIDIALSLSAFTVVYDVNSKPIASTGILDGNLPTPPSGVLQYAKDKGENRLTWEPKEGVIIAAVVKYYSSNGQEGYVLVGRSLREVERREDGLLKLTLIGIAITLIVSYIAIYLTRDKRK